MNLIGNPPYFILIYGGQTVVSETKSSSSTTINVRKNLDDLWVFSLYSSKWHQVYVNSVDNPSIREQSVMVTVNLERLAIMYGGFYADEVLNEMWYFNLFNNMWQRLNYKVDKANANSVVPPGLKGHTIVTSSTGLIMYGGETWLKSNLTITDKDYERKSVYLSSWQEALNAAGLTTSDIGTAKFAQAYADTGNNWFAETVPFLKQERSINYNTDVFVFPTNTCYNNWNNRGTWNYGRCTCTGIYYGSECQYIKCPNSLCFVDIDTVDPQEWYHWTGHGTWLGNGTWSWDDGYLGNDCSIKTCINDWKGDEWDEAFPISQCIWNETAHHGADDCSYTFWLNNCGEYGTCKDGSWTCDTGYIGEDCTIFSYDVSTQT